MNLDTILEAFDEIADRRGWRPLHAPRNLAAAIAVEAGELLEVLQWQRDDQPLDEAQRRRAAEEAADLLMYLVAFCDRAGIDLDAALAAKIAHNRTRFLDQSS